MRIVPYSLDLAIGTWEKVCGAKGFWSKIEGNNFDSFNASLMRSDLLLDLDVGLGRITHMEEGSSCRVHAIFWSKEIFRKMDDLKLLIMSIGNAFRLKRIECVIPRSSASLDRIMGKLGFEFEGILRRYYVIENGFEDGCMYSLLGGFHG